jgi:hypothetical protein
MPKKKSALNIEIAQQFKVALTNYGLKDWQISLLMAQAAHETDGFNHKLALENENYGGVKYNSHLSKVAIASTDYFAKASEDKFHRRMPYAHFYNINDFIKRWIPYAHLNGEMKGNNIGVPMDAISIADFAHRLKLNGYYQDSESVYFNGLKHWTAVLQQTDITHTNPAPNKPSSHITLANLIAAFEKIKLSNIFAQFFSKPPQQIPQVSNEMKLSPTFTILPFSIQEQKKPHLTDIHKLATHSKWIGRYKPIQQPAIDLPYTDSIWTVPELPAIRSGLQQLIMEPPAYLPFTDSFWTTPKTINDLHSSIFSNPADRFKVNNFEPFSEKYIPAITKDAPHNNFLPANPEFTRTPSRANHAGIPGNNAATPAHSPVNINLNKPLIQNFSISVKDTKEGITSLRRKVEEVLLDILNSAITT